MPAELRQAFPSAVAREPLVVFKRYPAERKSVRVGWAILSPAVGQMRRLDGTTVVDFDGVSMDRKKVD
jgi:hypothetical protein